MTERTKRTDRRADAKAGLVTERVLDLLLALRALGCARTSDLMAASAHPSRNSFNKWMRKILDAGLVAASAECLTDENTYVLTAKGWSAVAEAHPQAKDFPLPPRKEATEHRLLIAAAWTRIASDARADGSVSLSAWPEEVLRALGGAVVPDAFFRFTAEGSGTVTAIALEADAGTEGAVFLRKKADGYAALPLNGGLYGYRGFRVAWVVPDAKRAKALAKAVGEGAGAVEHLVACIDEIKTQGAFACAWIIAGKEPATATLGGILGGRR